MNSKVSIDKWMQGVWALVWALLTAQTAFAQSLEITGVVRDPQQAVISGAQTILTNTRTNARATTVTDSQGRYRFAALAPDTYVVEVHANGFQAASSARIALTDSSATHDVMLPLAREIDAVTVTGDAVDRYRVKAVTQLGPLGSAPLLDTPYTVNVLSSEVMINGQVKSFKEFSKFLPLAGFQEQQGSEVLRPATRGMQGANMQNTRMDGMGLVVTGGNSMEMLQQIEVLNGLGGALYGPANPSGMFNFVPKRPTDQPLQRVSFGYDNGSIGTIHADVGGRAGRNGMFGYRVNGLAASGDAFVKHSSLDRRLASVAGDVRPWTNTVIEGLYSYYNVIQRGFPGWFTYGRSSASSPFILLPSEAPDPTTEGLGQADAGLNLHSYIGQLRVKHDFNGNWRFSIGAQNQRADRDISTQVNALTSNTGNYTSSLGTGFAPRFRVFGNLAYLNGQFVTGSVRHDIAVGSTGYIFRSYSDFVNPTAASVRLGTASIAEPVVFALPAGGIPTHTNIFMSSVIHQQGVNAADTLTFNSTWSARIAVSQDWIWTDTYNNARVRTGGYKGNGASPLVSLMYKPAPQMTIYGTYGSSLQQGDIAPTTVTNAGEALAPYRSQQSEIGYKLAIRQVDFSTAVFRLNRPFATTDPVDNTFRISGDQVNWGWEAMATGRVTSNVVIHGGFTVLSPHLTKTGNVATDGKQFVNIPTFKSNVLTEYRLPLSRATFASANWQSVGRRAIDDLNSAWTPAYDIVDLGLRHTSPLMGTKTTWRVTVNNVGDVHYWSSLGPGNITGTNVGSYTAHLGAPRTVAASMEVEF